MIDDKVLTKAEIANEYDKLAGDTIFFGHMVMPDTFYTDSAEFHHEMSKAMNDPEIKILVIVVFRGAAKTSLGQAYITQKVVHEEHKVILYIGDTSVQAETHTEMIRMELESNARLIQLYGEQKGKKSWGAQRFTTLSGVTVLPRGSNQSIRGVKIGNHRPTLVVIDDAENDENVQTKEQRDKLWGRIFATVKPIMDRRGQGQESKIIMEGTPLHEDAVLLRMAALVKLLLKQGRTDVKLLTYGCMNEKGEPTWPEVWSKEKLIEEEELYAQAGMLDTFYQEYHVKVLSPEGSPFKKEQTRFWPADYEKPKSLLHYMSVDVAFSVGKTNDFSSIVCVGVGEDGRGYVEEGVRGRFKPDELYELLVDYCKLYNPLDVFVQNVTLDEFFAFFAQDRAINFGEWIPFKPVKISREKNAKVRRILQVAPLHKTGRLVFGRHQSDLLAELYSCPRAQYDDISDCLAVIVKEIFMARTGEGTRPKPGYFGMGTDGRCNINVDAMLEDIRKGGAWRIGRTDGILDG